MANDQSATIKLNVDSSGVTSAMIKAVAITNLASRKFLITAFMFFGSILIVLVKPELIGDGNATTLFTFWTMLLGVFGASNIGEHIVKGKK